MASADPAEREADRLRRAYRRRGPVEDRLGANVGQRILVAERDRAIRSALATAAEPIGSLLEIGCGSASIVGSLVNEGVARAGAGVDLLAEVIEVARAEYPRLDLHVAPAGDLPFPDGAFDAVVASTIFSSVPPGSPRTAILHEVARVLRPAGLFVWYDMRLPNPWNPAVRPFTAREVREALPGWDVRTRSVTLLPHVARRLGPAAGRLYPLLARVPVFRTHLVGIAQKP